MKCEISATVCSYNRASALKNCIESLINQDFQGPYQIIVVDDGSTDTTKEIVESFDARIPDDVEFTYVRHPKNKGLGAARNTATVHALAEIVAYTDDDVVVDTKWVQKIYDCYQAHPEAVAAGGMVRNGLTNSMIAEIGQQIVTGRLLESVDEHGYTEFLVGNNQTYRKKAVEDVGGFDESLIYGGDEAWIQGRLLAQGKKMVFDPAILVTHYQRSSIPSFLKQYYRYGFGLYITKEKLRLDQSIKSMLSKKETLATRVYRVLSQPHRVVPHVPSFSGKVVAPVFVYLSSVCRYLGYLRAKVFGAPSASSH